MTTVYTLDVDNYAPEITALTRPLLERWVQKIGATLHVITERKSPSMPPPCEKLQIYDLARQNGADWHLFVDADALIHPDMFDPTDHLPFDTVAHNGTDMAGLRWRYDDYMRRDGRHIGSCNWFTMASRWCLDLWHPLEDLTLEQALDNIFPIQAELASGVIERSHLLDDYILSRNVARYGLKVKTVSSMVQEMGFPDGFLWHEFLVPVDQKVAHMKDVLAKWDIR